jgi:hypothetical protein
MPYILDAGAIVLDDTNIENLRALSHGFLTNGVLIVACCVGFQ